MNKTICCLITVTFLAGCVSQPEVSDNPNFERIFKAKYEETWRALQQSIMPYPLRMNNMDTGQIQTVMIKNSSSSAFKRPGEKRKSSGYRYRLYFNVAKISDQKTRVSISKKAELVRDFISNPEERQSDGLEENVLLYRIGREIRIERALIKATSAKKQ